MITSVKSKARAEHDGERFDVVATVLFPELSRKKIKSVIDAGGAYLNKRRVKVAKMALREGDLVELFWEGPSTPSLGQARPKPSPLVLTEAHLVFVEKDFLVVNKPAGLPSQATLTSSTDTVLHALAALRPADFPLESLFLVHRLDKETSGLLVVARTTAARAHFEDAFRDRRVNKTYEALCFFAPKVAAGEVALPLAKDTSRANTYFALSSTAGARRRSDAKAALTRYETVRVFARAQASHVRCFPETGRTHQIRVHMQALGCPLLGDKTYAQNVVGHPFAQTALRHMLHAARLAFVGPGGNAYTLDAPHPPDFAACLEALARTEKGESTRS
ncbi:MAG: RluA family pseudouridine synthase [Silvanigrellales bacterium]|nr:RluA family pseudouridine synthase [Silvanigrellales bacterium]